MTDLNIAYQDTQYLAELYSKLGSLQADLANFDLMVTSDRLLLACLVLFFGLLIGVVIAVIIETIADGFNIDLGWGIWVIFVVVYVMVLVAIWYGLSEYYIMLKEHALVRDIGATEMAIRAIETKLGLI